VRHVHACKNTSGPRIDWRREVRVGVNVDETDALTTTLLPERTQYSREHATLTTKYELEWWFSRREREALRKAFLHALADGHVEVFVTHATW
jgi:hypothetical protein